MEQRRLIAGELRYRLREYGLFYAQRYRIHLRYLGKYPNGIARYRRFRKNGKCVILVSANSNE